MHRIAGLEDRNDLLAVAVDQGDGIAVWVADATLGGLLGGFDTMVQGPIQNAADQGFASLKERLEAEETAAGT